MSNQAKRLSDCPAERLAQCRGNVEVLGVMVSFGESLKEVSWTKGKMPTMGVELVDRAHVTRLQAEVSALQQRLNIADQHVSGLEVEVAKLRRGPCELIYGDELPNQGIPGTSFQRLNALPKEGE